MHSQEQEEAARQVRRLGGRLLKGHHWDRRTTHVVFGSVSSRGEKFLGGAAAGVFLLGRSFLQV
eukprot:9308700-Pyramimonas_sp.AAC.1